jgi:anthranilate synthase/aminodeoxychorismate synthase-like glutamine amidotransferase
LLVDNYDSFTHNLAQTLGSLGATVRVVRNDAVRLRDVERMQPRAIVISPGPGQPRNAGVSLGLVRRFAGRIPILGICLGMQCIAQVFGARIRHARRPVHGKTSAVRHDGSGIFEGVPSPFEAMRYHSLIVMEETLPAELRACAWSEEGEPMALRHLMHPIWGLQFHPESYRTPEGPRILGRWLESLRSEG